MLAARKKPNRAPKGAAALEFAIGVPVVMGIFIGGFVLVYATFTKERLTTATSQAVRYCSMQPANINMSACVSNLARTIFGADNARCDQGVRFDVQTSGDLNDQTQISMLQATARCTYLSPVWPNRLPPLNLSAEARMPRMPITGP